MSDTREITESMAPNEVVAFLNDGTQSGSIPTALDDILDDIRDGQLSLHGFDEDNTRVVNAVNDWFDDDKIACLVCETKNEQVVYTLSEVQDVSGSFLVWWWKKYDASAYTELMGAIEQGRKFQFLLHEGQGNRFLISETIQEVWEVARDIPRKHSLKFFKKVVKEEAYFSNSWETVDDYQSRHWRQWLSRGGFVRFKPKGIDMFVCVSDDRNKGALSFWQELIEDGDTLGVLRDVDKSGVMSSPSKFPYRDLCSKVKGYREDLSDVKIANNDPSLSENGRVNIVHMFVTVNRYNEPSVYMLSDHFKSYDWRVFDDIEVISPYLHKVGWVDNTQNNEE